MPTNKMKRIRNNKRYLTAILSGVCLWVVVAACDGEDGHSGHVIDPRDNKTYEVSIFRGKLWFMEDLKFEDTIVYSYQQALNACPPGWSLPSEQDWIELNNYFGGYIYNREEIGNPTGAFNRMKKEFGLEEEVFYWTSTPAWNDAATIRSSIFYSNSYFQAMEYGAIVINARLHCRCIKEETNESDADVIQFKINNQVEKFDFYRIDQPHDPDRVRLFLHRRLDKTELVDRVDFQFKLPTSFVHEDQPVVAADAFFEHQSGNLTGSNWESQIAASPDNLELIITHYDGSVVRGKFSGYANLGIEEGTFQLKINN